MRLALAVALSLALFATASAQPDLPPTLAFPSAEGFARYTPGGRDGTLYHVINLNDSGPGSLRDGVSQDHRLVVFDLAGDITLKSPLHIASQITIAGQSTAGDGITIAGAEVSLSDSHDLILRYLRIRQGLSPGEDKKSAINMTGAKNILLDHLSIAWGRWDTIDMNLCTNVTIQHCIIGPGVDPQRFGCLCQCDRVTFTHNLFINNQSRNPKAKGIIQYVNNVVYNWGVVGLVGGHSAADHTLDVINNYFIQGPNSSTHFLGEFTSTDHVYQSGNLADMNKDGQLNGRPVLPVDFTDSKGAPTLVPASTMPKDEITLDSAEAAYDEVIANAGDSLRRDSVDQRLIADVTSLGKEGKVIHDPAESAPPQAANPAPRQTAHPQTAPDQSSQYPAASPPAR